MWFFIVYFKSSVCKLYLLRYIISSDSKSEYYNILYRKTVCNKYYLSSRLQFVNKTRDIHSISTVVKIFFTHIFWHRVQLFQRICFYSFYWVEKPPTEWLFEFWEKEEIAVEHIRWIGWLLNDILAKHSDTSALCVLSWCKIQELSTHKSGLL